MDSITQGVLGAAAAQAVLKRRLPQGVGWIGALGGLLADADVFIQSSSDPTVGWLFHRHFTHSLFFIPIGGLIAALPFLWLKRFRHDRTAVIWAAIIGYATHAPLDWLTSYGTQLLWPFSNQRFALDWIGIIDPIYTVLLAIGLYLTARTTQPRFVRRAFLLATLYLCFGGWQHYRAWGVQQDIAARRGHQIAHARVMPAPGSLLMWRSVYTFDGQMSVDGIRVPWFGGAQVAQGGVADVVTFSDLPATAQANAETKRRFEIFQWFADGLIAPIADAPQAYGDMRITAEVESLIPLWGVQIDETGTALRWTPPPGQRREIGRALHTLFFSSPQYHRFPMPVD
jgi:inner membrane protein